MFMSQRKVTAKELDFYLYGRTDVSPVKLEDGGSEDETSRQQSIAKKIPNYSGMNEYELYILPEAFR